MKRTEHKSIDYLEDQELRALLESVDQNSRNGRRDYALLLFCTIPVPAFKKRSTSS